MKVLVSILSIIGLYHLFTLSVFTISPLSGYGNIATSEFMLLFGGIGSVIFGLFTAKEIIDKYRL